MRISIRQRLTAWYAAALLLGLGIFALGMWVSLQERLIAGVDARLSQRMKGLQTALGPEAKIRDRIRLQQELAEYVGEISDGSLVQLRETSGVLLLPSPKQPAMPPPRGRTDCAIYSGNRRPPVADRKFPHPVRRLDLRSADRGVSR